MLYSKYLTDPKHPPSAPAQPFSLVPFLQSGAFRLHSPPWFNPPPPEISRQLARLPVDALRLIPYIAGSIDERKMRGAPCHRILPEK